MVAGDQGPPQELERYERYLREEQDLSATTVRSFTTRVYLATMALLNTIRPATTTIGPYEDQYPYSLRDRVQLTRLEQLYVLMSLPRTATIFSLVGGWN